MAARRRGVDEHLAVFGAYWYRGYSCNPRAIYEKARELVPGMRGVWVVQAATPSARCRRASSTSSPARASTST